MKKPKLKFQNAQGKLQYPYVEDTLNMPNIPMDRRKEGGIYNFKGRPQTDPVEGFDQSELSSMQGFYDWVRKWYNSPRAKEIAKRQNINLDQRLTNMENIPFSVQNQTRNFIDPNSGKTFSGVVRRGVKDDTPQTRVEHIDPQRLKEIQSNYSYGIDPKKEKTDRVVWADSDKNRYSTNIVGYATPRSYFEEMVHGSIMGDDGSVVRNNHIGYNILGKGQNVEDRFAQEIRRDDTPFDVLKKQYAHFMHDQIPMEAQANIMKIRYIVDKNKHLFGNKDIFKEGLNEQDIQTLYGLKDNINNPELKKDLERIFQYYKPQHLLQMDKDLVKNQQPSQNRFEQQQHGYVKRGGVLKPKIHFRRY